MGGDEADETPRRRRHRRLLQVGFDLRDDRGGAIGVPTSGHGGSADRGLQAASVSFGRIRYTLRGARARSAIHAVVDGREDVVPMLELADDGLAQPTLGKLAEQATVE